MNKLQTYQVYPNIPAPLAFLETLSRNIWWSWKHRASDLFRRIDPRLWKESRHNPIVLLTLVSQDRLEELAVDDSFLAHMDEVRERFNRRVLEPVNHPDNPLKDNATIAYLSMEFGIHESLPLFAGGLGILAGDHLKAASNMALPVTGVGLLYSQGYFKQFLDPSGWQQEDYPETDFFTLPIERATDPGGQEIRIAVTGPDGDIRASVWKLQIGRIPLYLLDTNLPENPPEIRGVTARLYAGDPKQRLAQEVLLGIGGIRALSALGITANVCHMNEGHSAFSGLERLALTMATHRVDLKTAVEIIARTTVFTTHTPVAAGHDEFPPDMVRPILRPFQEPLGISEREILSWGQTSSQSPFSMFIFGLRMAQDLNGVSRLHGRVARRMWSSVWPDRPEDEVPISHITNGVHIPTWISPEIALLYERYLGPDWFMSSREPKNIERIDDIYDEELWRAHEMARSRLLRTCRELMVNQYDRRNAPKAAMEDAKSVLAQGALTIGFARRFATYKRATLLFRDPDRLEAILMDSKRPVQFIFAGKAHPKDNEGKALIQRIVEFARKPNIRRKLIFLENYDVHLAQHLYHGVDVWLNTPRRPFEACGTSGMKAALNGGLNLSILDGWWAEAFNPECGWAIGTGAEGGDPGYQDAVESQALYNILENDVIPAFYDRLAGDAPSRWSTMMKSSMKLAMEHFCSLRMVEEYSARYYMPAAARFDELVADNARKARDLAVQHERIRSLWNRIRIEQPRRNVGGPMRVGEAFTAGTVVHLGELRPDEVDVHLYYGRMMALDAVASSRFVPMAVAKDLGGGSYRYECTVICDAAGRYGFTARVVPRGDQWIQNTPGLLTWADAVD